MDQTSSELLVRVGYLEKGKKINLRENIRPVENRLSF
jgi:hypothetical protein